MKILHLLPDFGYHAPARQVALLAPELTRTSHIVDSAALGTGRRMDPARWWHLQRLVAELQPDVVHAWRLPALRAAGVIHLLARRSFRLVVSEPRRGGRLNAFDALLLRRADAVAANDPAEAVALRRLGVAAERIQIVPPAVAAPELKSVDAPTALLDVSLPPDARVVMCVGAMTPPHGFYDTVWAADILKYAIPELHLVIVGDGPERGRLWRFIQANQRSRGEEYIHLLPACPNAAALLPRADVVWVPSRSECGRQVLLEAFAAGRPVIASALPGLAALVSEGVNGLLTPPSDPPTLARQTRRLLDDTELAQRLGAAARQTATMHAPEYVLPALVRLYE